VATQLAAGSRKDLLAANRCFTCLANLDDESRLKAEDVIKREITAVDLDHSVVKGNGCAACHILFKVKDTLKVSEQDAADLLSEVLMDNEELNNEFISMVEDIHMKARMMGVTFAMKTREAKDRYIDANFKNTISELQADASVYGTEIVMRKLLLSNIALNIAQNLGIDYHAATEELYYYMRKNDQDTHGEMMRAIRSLLAKVGSQKD
jgi:hypothetical protein